MQPDYLSFYNEELISQIEKDYSEGSKDTRGILGLSFGGLNSMDFAIQGNDTFGKVVCLSHRIELVVIWVGNSPVATYYFFNH